MELHGHLTQSEYFASWGWILTLAEKSARVPPLLPHQPLCPEARGQIIARSTPSLSLSLPPRSAPSILGPLTSSEWWSNLKYRAQQNLPKENICWGDSGETHSVQSIFALLPTQDLLEMVGNFPFGDALLLFKSAVLCSLWTRRRTIVWCYRVKRRASCNGSGLICPHVSAVKIYKKTIKFDFAHLIEQLYQNCSLRFRFLFPLICSSC